MLLVDTVKVDHERGICLSDCIKSPKDVLFFLNSQSDEDDKEKVKQKKAPAKANGHVSPTKHKVAGGKILRNKTRNAEVEETVNAIAEHQKELHAQRLRDGIARYSEAGAGANTKEGKTWKRFQSYKGEAALPKDTENLRVRLGSSHFTTVLIKSPRTDHGRQEGSDRHPSYSWLRGAVPH